MEEQNAEYICTLVAQLVERTPAEEIRQHEGSFQISRLPGTEYALALTKKNLSYGFNWHELELFGGEVTVFQHHQEEKTRHLGRVIDQPTLLGNIYRTLTQRYDAHVRQLRENLAPELEAAVGILVDRETVGEG